MAHIGQYWRVGIIVQAVWALVAGIFVFARLTTRYYLGPDRLGYDDWLLLTAWILYFCKATLAIVSYFPMFWGYTVLEYYTSTDYLLLYRAEIMYGVGLFTSCLEEVVLRTAVAAFLYRLAVNRRHKYMLLTVLIPTVLWSFAYGIVLLEYMVRLAIHPFNMALVNDTATGAGRPYFVWVCLVDFFFALFPWYMFHDVRMKKSKKLFICCSLSLGVIAGGCGIAKIHTVFSYRHGIDDVMYMFIYSCFERGLLYICICIPSFLPVWTHVRENRRRKQLEREGGEGQRIKRNKPGDSVIHDPRMEELLIETVPTSPGQRIMGTKMSNVGEEEKDAADLTHVSKNSTKTDSKDVSA